MHSQSADNRNAGCVENQPRSFIAIAPKSTNNQIVTMTKRKQIKSSSTNDLTVANVLQKITGTPTKSISSSSPIKHITHSKSQQITTVRQMSRAVVPRVSPNNGRTDLSDDQSKYQVYQSVSPAPPYAPPSSTISISMSSPYISTQNSNFHSNNQYRTLPPQLQVQQSHAQPCHNDIGRPNHTNRPNNIKKIYNYNPRYKRNNNSSSSDKMYSSNNNNNNNSNINNNNINNNEYERSITNNKSGSHPTQQVSRNGHRPYNSDSSKNISPSRDHYSSSSSSSSSSSMPLTKKRDSRTTAGYGYEQRELCYINQPWSHNPYVDECQNPMYYDWARNDGYSISRSMNHHPQSISYTIPGTGETMTVTNVVDGKSNHRVNKSNRGNHKNGSIIKRYTPPDRFMNRAPHIEIKETPTNLTNGSKWDRLSIQVWEKFMISQQKEVTYTKKIKMWKNMYCTVQETFSDYSLFMVGSTISGFGTDVSDVDMCLVHSAKNGPIYVGNDLRIHSAKILKDFEELLRRNAIYGDFNLIPAKVPILRFKDTFHEFEIDLNYNNYVGIQNTRLMYCYGRMDWRLRPLALVVKIWAQYHGINNAKEMTISSYSLVLMVIHFLQCAVSPPVLPCLHDLHPNKFQKHQEVKSIDMHEELAPWFSQNDQALGELFFQFFQYYTNFDFSSKAISVRKGSAISIESCKNNNSPKNDPNQWKELCIEEPFDFTNTAHSCYDPLKFQWIRRVFSMSYEAIVNTRDLKSIFENPFMPIIP